MRSELFWNWYEGWCVPKMGNNTRDISFRKMFEYLDEFDRPVVIVETGCLEEIDNWAGNGCSSILFDRYVDSHPGSILRSCDINHINVELTREAFISGNSTAACGDSVEVLKKWAKEPFKIDLLYLDASHCDWNNVVPAANHHLNELYAIMPALREDTLVVVDDSPLLDDDFPRLLVGGKGAFVAKHAAAIGANLQFHEYQVGWTNMTARPTQATDDLRELIKRAREYQDAHHLVQADELYRLVLTLAGREPKNSFAAKAKAEACAFFGWNAVEKHKLGTAVDWYRDAVMADPGWVDFRLLLSAASHKLGLWQLARSDAERATRIAPQDHQAWKALGDMELLLENAPASVVAYDKQIETAPADFLDCYCDRAAVAIDTEDYATANAMCDKMMGTKSEKDAWHIRGMIHYRLGEYEEAITCYDKALAMKARDLPQVHWNRGMALHSIGRYREGWQEHEWRKHCSHHRALAMPFKRFVLPAWQRQPPPAVIHVHGEAGAGDNLACSRYLALLVRDGYQVRYECLGTMEKLFRDSFPAVEVTERAKDYPGALGIKMFDYHCPIGSLPAVYETDIDTVPWFGPYLKADPELVKHYDKLLGPRTRQRVGLCWSSGIILNDGIWMERYGRKKSMHFDDLDPLLQNVGHVQFVNLQVGPERAQLNDYYVDDVLPEKPAWHETAALIESLDLVITVDTGVAHLAGAMGKPTWLMMHGEGSWHFMVERPGASWNERSPWYPNTRLFRVKKSGDWAPVVQRIAAELAELKAEAA